jgi:hypothetical protein
MDPTVPGTVAVTGVRPEIHTTAGPVAYSCSVPMAQKTIAARRAATTNQ